MTTIYNSKIVKVLDVIILLALAFVAVVYIFYSYGDRDLLMSSPNSTFEGEPRSCFNYYDPLKCPSMSTTLYPKTPYIKEVNPYLYWVMQNQLKIAALILIYLGLTRWGMWKKDED